MRAKRAERLRERSLGVPTGARAAQTPQQTPQIRKTKRNRLSFPRRRLGSGPAARPERGPRGRAPVRAEGARAAPVGSAPERAVPVRSMPVWAVPVRSMPMVSVPVVSVPKRSVPHHGQARSASAPRRLSRPSRPAARSQSAAAGRCAALQRPLTGSFRLRGRGQTGPASLIGSDWQLIGS